MNLILFTQLSQAHYITTPAPPKAKKITVKPTPAKLQPGQIVVKDGVLLSRPVPLTPPPQASASSAPKPQSEAQRAFNSDNLIKKILSHSVTVSLSEIFGSPPSAEKRMQEYLHLTRLSLNHIVGEEVEEEQTEKKPLGVNML